MITNVSKVVVPVDDQQSALEFWTTIIGFTAVRDDVYADERWIEVKPPHQNVMLVLSRGRGDETLFSAVQTSNRPTQSSGDAVSSSHCRPLTHGLARGRCLRTTRGLSTC
jgi:hypothetical protein